MASTILAVACCLSLLAVGQAGLTGRIVGGDEAYEGQFPYQISLRYRGSHACGGSIISRNYILTAAHCVTYEDEDGNIVIDPPHLYSIRAGSSDRFRGGVLINVVNIAVHEDYGNLLNDVAVLKLEEPLIFSKNIQAIPLASAATPVDSDVIISGWGRVSTNGDIPTKLKWNTLTYLSKTKCATQILVVSDTLICLGHKSNNGACFGDSGGPAAYNNELIGVAGFVFNGCGSSRADGYAKVFYHVDWIKKHSDL